MTLIEIPRFMETLSPRSWGGLNLTGFEAMQDSVYWKARCFGSRGDTAPAIVPNFGGTRAKLVELVPHPADAGPRLASLGRHRPKLGRVRATPRVRVR